MNLKHFSFPFCFSDFFWKFQYSLRLSIIFSPKTSDKINKALICTPQSFRSRKSSLFSFWNAFTEWLSLVIQKSSCEKLKHILSQMINAFYSLKWAYYIVWGLFCCPPPIERNLMILRFRKKSNLERKKNNQRVGGWKEEAQPSPHIF